MIQLNSFLAPYSVTQIHDLFPNYPYQLSIIHLFPIKNKQIDSPQPTIQQFKSTNIIPYKIQIGSISLTNHNNQSQTNKFKPNSGPLLNSMYGRSGTNIFNKNSNNSSSTSGNIFTRNNNNNNSSNNNNNSSYNNPYNSSYNNSSYGSNNNNNNGIGPYGSHRVPDYKVGNMPRSLQEINVKWKSNELNPLSISIRPETLHLSVVELRTEDYFLIRKQKATQDIQRGMEEVLRKKCFNDNLFNSHVVDGMREPDTFRQGPPGMEVIRQLKNRNTLSGVVSGSGNNPSNNNSSNNNSSSNIFNRNTNNSSNIFSSSNNNNSSSNNIFGNNNSNNNRNIFSSNSNNNNSGGDIFNRNNNNSSSNMFNNNNNNTNSSNIFASNNNGGNNIFSNGNNKNNNNSSNIFSSSNNNNSGGNIFNRNNNSSGYNNNIFSNNNNNNSSNNNSFSNNNNNSSNNIFNRNNNSNNNIFANNSNNNSNNSRNLFNNNSNQNQNNSQNQTSGSLSDYAFYRIADQNQKLIEIVMQQQKQQQQQGYFGNGRSGSLTEMYFGEENGRGFGRNGLMTNSLGMSSLSNNSLFPSNNYPSINGFGTYQSSSLTSYPSYPPSPSPFPEPQETLIPTTQFKQLNPKLQKLLTESFHPYKNSTHFVVQKKVYQREEEEREEEYPQEEGERQERQKNERQTQMRVSQNDGVDERRRMINQTINNNSQRNNVANLFHPTNSHYVPQNMQMRQQPNHHPSAINSSTTNQALANYQSLIDRQSSLSSHTQPRKFHLPVEYRLKFKHFDGITVENLEISNEYGKIFWPDKMNVQNLDLSENFKIEDNFVLCAAPQLDKLCFVTFFSVPEGLDSLDETAAKEGLDDFLKSEFKGNVELQNFSIVPPEYRIKIRQISQFNPNNTQDSDAIKGTLAIQSEIYQA